jgi:hypothetical protein
MKFYSSWLFLFLSVFYCQAQEKNNPIPLTYQSTMVGLGGMKVYDSYLSPLRYTGSNFSVMYEQMKMTRLMNGKVSSQHLLNLEIANTTNPTQTATNMVGYLDYAYGLYYKLNPIQKLQLFAGLQIDAWAGVIYNNRNGNNPASAKANLNLNLSGMLVYPFQIKQQPVLLRYQLSLPFMGVLFSPAFGQSYYEIGLGVNDNLFHFASFHNQLAMRNLLSVEFPFNSYTLRLGYMNWIYETQVNDLDTRIMTNTIYVGFSKNFFIVSGRKQDKKQFQTVFD